MIVDWLVKGTNVVDVMMEYEFPLLVERGTHFGFLAIDDERVKRKGWLVWIAWQSCDKSIMFYIFNFSSNN